MRRRRFMAAAATLCAVARSGLAQAPPSSPVAARDAALSALARQLDLPLVDAVVAVFARQLRRSLPDYVVASIGAQLGLGPSWRRGDPAFDDAVRRLDAALAAAEARGGPLVTIDRDDLLAAFEVPWSLDDIAFVAATRSTPLGRAAERAIDAKGAEQAIATLRRRIARGPDGVGIADAFADLDAQAKAKFGGALLDLLALRGVDPDRAQRLQRLVEQVRAAPSDAIGARFVERLSAKLVDAALKQVPGFVSAIGGAVR